jgi:hypothetical protein
VSALVLQLLALSLRPVVLVAVALVIAVGLFVAPSIRRPARSSSGHADHRPGGRQRMQTKPDWDVEELRLLEAGYTPRWDAEEERLAQVLRCTHDASKLVYVGLAKGPVSLVFGVCPACQRWVCFHGAQR